MPQLTRALKVASNKFLLARVTTPGDVDALAFLLDALLLYVAEPRREGLLRPAGGDLLLELELELPGLLFSGAALRSERPRGYRIQDRRA